jgi:SOS-response transcriptional repressor LexA
MHKIQQSILDLAKKQDLSKMTLRDIANYIPESKGLPQSIKHHLDQLVKKGFEIYKKTSNSNFLRIPIIGTADCGDASIFAEQNYQGFLTISKKLVNTKSFKDLFAIQAVGSSMNKASIGESKKNIEDGDYVLVDRSKVKPQTGDVVLAVVNGGATIKKFTDDTKTNNQIILSPLSTHSHSPIYIHEDDGFLVNGKVVEVVKKPN